ncbi:MFS transporter [Nonomuraea dietziae]|uniref:MFS transporter n=1 Tax=Nonomuraea dietziae TaxID=65515 RepID=UPI0031D1E9ED
MAVGPHHGGRLGDLYGRKRMFVIGALGFTVASLLCGVSMSPEMLIGSRVLQGLFGAVMIPQGLGLIREMFPPEEIGKAFGLFGPVMTHLLCRRPRAGGLAGRRRPVRHRLAHDLPDQPADRRRRRARRAEVSCRSFRLSNATRLDLGGMVLVSAAAFLLIFPLIQGQEAGWPAWTFACMAGSVVMFALFGAYEARRQRSGKDPLVTPACSASGPSPAVSSRGCPSSPA